MATDPWILRSACVPPRLFQSYGAHHIPHYQLLQLYTSQITQSSPAHTPVLAFLTSTQLTSPSQLSVITRHPRLSTSVDGRPGIFADLFPRRPQVRGK